MQVEFSFPPFLKSRKTPSTTPPSEWRFLPFLALPDGVHNCQQGMKRVCGLACDGVK